ncbi:MAG: PaaI family thioesterase [Caulobacterales bacterium]|jgi:uncharacterized protein (TIGR00369 family)
MKGAETDVPEAHRQFVELAFAAQAPLAGFGCRLTGIEPGRVTIAFDAAEHLTTRGSGAVMGGVIATVADVAAGLALITRLEAPGPVVTMQMNSHFLRPAIGGVITCIGAVERIGRGFATVSARAVHHVGDKQTDVALLTAQFQIL